jgi:hypothetical protein
MRKVVLALFLVASPVASAAAAETLNSVLADDGKTLAYTPCEAEESAECVSHALHCRGDEGFGYGLAMTVIGAGDDPDVRKLARILIDKPYGEAKVAFTVGEQMVELGVHAVTVSTDEMNGDWDLALHFMSDGDFYDALTEQTATRVSADVAGHTLPLSTGKTHAGHLLALKEACTK